MPDDIRTTASKMITEWKIMVFYRRMSLKEFDMRREAVQELFRRMGEHGPRGTGWGTLYEALKRKDTSLLVPDEIKPRVFRGGY